MPKQKTAAQPTTEERIITAAQKVFLRKGFSATRTRDIAEEAGINLALLNYYFRSKQKLFELVMREKFQKLTSHIVPVLNNTTTSLEQKIELITDSYIEALSENPDLPIFVLNELRKKNFEFLPGMPTNKIFMESSFFSQLKKRRVDINPVQFLLTLVGMVIFPFIARPMLLVTGIATDKTFIKLINERKALIPVWMTAILKSK